MILKCYYFFKKLQIMPLKTSKFLWFQYTVHEIPANSTNCCEKSGTRECDLGICLVTNW